MGKWVDGESWLVTRGARVDTRCSMLVPGCWMLEKSFTAENAEGTEYISICIYTYGVHYILVQRLHREKKFIR